MKADGILGLGFMSKYEDELTLMDNMYNQGLIDKNMFAIYLSKNEDYSHDFESTITFGGMD
eukprot:CAMPEP_0168316066 /NCGR_PEP_ID=MMETSP0210-20121227/14127_1 /TAXON_ID=40633 /ORGANISM="Condylostoma magnum, Strain COL2" /LENGTH=60 /DNA_ID=CAMNT_0008294367 /DNA_START=453 /DNA_END=635 /DNA_ORIENTATION=-